jgi:hypothetical protein
VKLNKIDVTEPVTLIDLLLTNTSHLSSEFLEYDTVYYEDGQIYHFPLNHKMDCLLLFFVDAHGTLFTTIRRTTKDKETYYLNSVGDQFKVVIDK